MVDRPELSLRGAVPSAVGSSVPDVPSGIGGNFRSVRGVEPVGIEQQARTSAVASNAAQQQFERNLQERADEQKLASEARFSAFSLMAQEQADRVQNNERDPSKIAESTLKIYNKMTDQFLASKGLSDFEREYLTDRTNSLRNAVVNNAVSVEAQARAAAVVSNVEEIKRNASLSVMKNPSLMEANLNSIESFLGKMSGVSEAQRKVLFKTARKDLALAAATGLINHDPASAKEAIAGGRFDNFIDADTKQAMLDDADAEIRQRRAEKNREQEELSEKASSAIVSLAISQANGDVDKEGRPIRVTNSDIKSALDSGMLKPGDARVLIEFKNNVLTNAGNDSLAAKLTSDITRAQLEGRPFGVADVLSINDALQKSGEPGLSAPQMKSLAELIETPSDDITKNYINQVLKPSMVRQDMFGNPLNETASDIAKLQSFNRAAIELRRMMTAAREAGRDPSTEILNVGPKVLETFRIPGEFESLTNINSDMSRPSDIPEGSTRTNKKFEGKVIWITPEGKSVISEIK
jgi:hypothetical protein